MDDAVNRDALLDWIEYRASLGKPLSEQSIKGLCNKLKLHSFYTQKMLVAQAITNKKKSVFQANRLKNTGNVKPRKIDYF